ncbi:unnamed protein product, partial [Mesorhabditis belari]|uniref:RGS domain-containing protein n=1 Tax=Mesorhabditis belari TaxID=2138241 RepID=A0AAF3ESK4_9BILA
MTIFKLSWSSKRRFVTPDPSAESEGAFVKRCSKVLDQIIHEESKFLDTSDGEPQSILSSGGDALFNNEEETIIDTNLHHQKEMRDDFDKENNVQGQPCTSSAPDMEELGVSAVLCGGVVETNSSREMRVFKRVLREPPLRKPFHLFLEQQFCAENLNFYVAVEQFHDLPHESTSRAAIENRELVARRIYERHFAPNSMEPVNVDNSTSKRIREAISAQHYHRTVFDVAQYQIFHLLKYDCWPRYLKAGGIAPEFSDEELADEADRKDSDGRGDHDDQAGPSGGGGKEKGRGWASSAIAAIAGSGSPNSSTKEKRRSGGFWHGFDRISRRLKKDGQSEAHQGSRSSGGAGSPVAEKRHSQVHRTSSSRGGSSNEERRKSYSSELEDECCSTTGGRPGVSSVGSRRRHLFSQGKQISMPAEIHAQISSHRVAPRVIKKSCTLMSGDSCSSELVELDDPSFSVAKWTQTLSAKLGLDAKCCEAVDAQTGCTIDPCRQAIDALQNRFVRIVPVVTMAIEILPSNFNFKSPQTTPPKIVLLRARHSLSTAAALRPLLAKYSVDLAMIVVVIGGTLEQISRLSVQIGNIGSKTLTVMSHAQFQERQQGKEMGRVNWKDPLASIPPEQSALLQYHQHGDISYCEITSEAERAKLRGEHSLGLTKFLRKASAAVTNKEEPPKEQKTSLKGTQATGVRRRSVGQGVASGVYCGEEPQNDPNQKEPAKKRLSIFKNKGEERSGGEKSPIPGTRRSPQMGVRGGEKEKESNGDTPRTPAIYATKIINDEDVDSGAFIWQPAAYV